jgi:hypothetical protein
MPTFPPVKRPAPAAHHIGTETAQDEHSYQHQLCPICSESNRIFFEYVTRDGRRTGRGVYFYGSRCVNKHCGVELPDTCICVHELGEHDTEGCCVSGCTCVRFSASSA